MNKIIAINSENSNNANNFSVIVPPFKIAPFSQICLTNFVGSNKKTVNIDDNNDTIVFTTGESYTITGNTKKGLRPCTAKIEHGSYKTQGVISGTIAKAVEEALNKAEGLPYNYVGGFAVTEAASVLTIKLDVMAGARSDGAVNIASNFTGLSNPGYDEGNDFVYSANTVGVNTDNTVTTGVNKRSVVSQKDFHYLESDIGSFAGGATNGGLEFKFEVPNGLDPIEYINGYFGILRSDSIHSDYDQNASFYINKRDTGGTLNAVDQNGDPLPETASGSLLSKQNYFFHAAFFVGNDGVVYLIHGQNDDDNMRVEKTGTTLAVDAVNDRDIIFSIRTEFDTNEYKIGYFISQEISGNPVNFTLLDSFGEQSQALSHKYKAFWIDGTDNGLVAAEINGDYFDPDNKKTGLNTNSNLDFTIFYNRPSQGDIDHFNIEQDINILGKANFNNTWHVDTLRYVQAFPDAVIKTSTSFAAGVETGGMNNSPQKKLYLINCPSLPINSMVCNATNRNLITSIGQYYHGYDNQKGFEDWISIDNPVEIDISNLQFYITDIYGNPVDDFENNVSFIIKFRHEPHKIQTSLIREQSAIIEELRRKTAQSRENIAIDQQINI